MSKIEKAIEIHTGLPYDVGDGTIDYAFQGEFVYINDGYLIPDDMPDIVFIEYNPEVFIRLK